MTGAEVQVAEQTEADARLADEATSPAADTAARAAALGTDNLGAQERDPAREADGTAHAEDRAEAADLCEKGKVAETPLPKAKAKAQNKTKAVGQVVSRNAGPSAVETGDGTSKDGPPATEANGGGKTEVPPSGGGASGDLCPAREGGSQGASDGDEAGVPRCAAAAAAAGSEPTPKAAETKAEKDRNFLADDEAIANPKAVVIVEQERGPASEADGTAQSTGNQKNKPPRRRAKATAGAAVTTLQEDVQAAQLALSVFKHRHYCGVHGLPPLRTLEARMIMQGKDCIVVSRAGGRGSSRPVSVQRHSAGSLGEVADQGRQAEQRTGPQSPEGGNLRWCVTSHAGRSAGRGGTGERRPRQRGGAAGGARASPGLSAAATAPEEQRGRCGRGSRRGCEQPKNEPSWIGRVQRQLWRSSAGSGREDGAE
jgi:hypothetical protein